MLKKILLSILIVFVLLMAFSESARNTVTLLFQLMFEREVSLKKEDSRVNILLLGNPGGIHEGKDLTDTIIVLSIDQGRREALLISIPRDLWILELENKVNTAYIFGEEKKEGGGLTLAKAAAQKVTGLDLHYAVKIDFSGFVKAVDAVGGLDIEVENSFDDYGYPIEGRENDLCGAPEQEIEKLASPAAKAWEIFPCRFENIRFEKGKQHFDGQSALKFVRSRNAEGSEGTDFARSKRQQKVLSAFAEKVFSLGVLLNPVKVESLFSILRENVDSNIKTSELDDFIRLAKKMEGAKIRSIVIDYGDEENGREGLLVNPAISEAYGSQWVLIPRIGNGEFSEIHEYISCHLTSEACPIQ